MKSIAASHRYTDGAAAPPVWVRPDPALAAAGIEGEFVVARVRLLAMALLMIAPTWNIIHHPEDPMHVTGFSVTLAASIAALAIWLTLRRGPLAALDRLRVERVRRLHGEHRAGQLPHRQLADGGAQLEGHLRDVFPGDRRHQPALRCAHLPRWRGCWPWASMVGSGPTPRHAIRPRTIRAYVSRVGALLPRRPLHPAHSARHRHHPGRDDRPPGPAAAVPRLARPAHGAVQSRPLRPGARRGDGSAARDGSRCRWPSSTSITSSRSTTLRPCPGRPRAVPGGRSAEPRHAAHRHGGPLRRRGVRHPDAGDVAGGGTGPDGGAAARDGGHRRSTSATVGSSGWISAPASRERPPMLR